MEKYKIETTSDFLHDLEHALDYITFELLNPIASSKLYNAVYAKIKTLSFAPKVNHIINNLYSAKVKHYKIIYEVVDGKNLVKLLHFWYARRDIKKLLQ